MDSLITPQLTRRMFVASTVMMIVAVALSAFNAVSVLSAPRSTTVGVPSTIGFEGFLAQSNGAPVTDGAYDLTFAVYSVATGGSNVWDEVHNDVQVTNGLYSVVLGAADAFSSTTFDGNRWIGVTVDGGTEISPRTKVNSVPFALNADNANKIGGGGVANMVAAFDGACPSGWTEFTQAQGRTIVGVPASGTLGAAVGTALSDQENRPVGQHNHTATQASHSHTVLMPVSLNGTGGGDNPWAGPVHGGLFNHGNGVGTNSQQPAVTVNNAGSVAGTNAPYIQLRYCKLNP